MFSCRFGGRLEAVECLCPETIEISAQDSQATWIHVVDASRASRPVFDESGLFEDFEVLRYGRPAHRQLAREFADGARPLGQALENRASGAIGDGIPHNVLVSAHER